MLEVAIRSPSGQEAIQEGRSVVMGSLALMRIALAALALTVGLALPVTAPRAAGETRLTHAQLVERAFGICAAASNGIARVRPALSFDGAARATRGVLVHLRYVANRLNALHPSGEDAARLRRYVWLLRREVAALERAERAARRDDRRSFRAAFLDAGATSLKARAVAMRLGLEVCSTI